MGSSSGSEGWQQPQETPGAAAVPSGALLAQWSVRGKVAGVEEVGIPP